MALPTPAAFRAAPAEASARFPGQSVAWEFLTGLVQVLDNPGQPGGEGTLSQLVARADHELARLDALAAAACDPSRLARLTDALRRSGIELAPVQIISEPDGTPLAWYVQGCRPL